MTKTIEHKRAMELSTVLHALSDPARRRMLKRLSTVDDLCCAEAADPGAPKSTTSNNFRILREAGLVETERAGVQARNSLNRSGVDAAFPGLLDSVLNAVDL